MLYYNFCETSIGILFIMASEDKITGISLNKPVNKTYILKETELIRKAKTELREYFQGKRKNFDLPLDICGTSFQVKVWQELMNIPYGETKSYKEIAEKICCPKGFRAIGNANNKNKFIIVIPCHRVIGANGNLVGYAAGINIKEKLLHLERSML